MKFSEFLTEAPIVPPTSGAQPIGQQQPATPPQPASPAQPKAMNSTSLKQLAATAAQLTPIALAKLIRDIEDIKKGGDKWRSAPSTLGVKSSMYGGFDGNQ